MFWNLVNPGYGPIALNEGVGGVSLANSYFMAPTFAALRPSYSTPTGIASYTDGAYSMSGSGAAGSKAFTRSGGHPVADAGTGTWYCVIEYDDGSLEFNVVVSRSGDVFTLAHALADDAVGLHCAHSTALGQHLSPKGNAALAQYVWGLTRAEVARYWSTFTMWHGDVFDYNFAVPSPRSSLIWQSYGGLPTTNHPAQGVANIAAAGNLICADATNCVTALTDAAGEGLQLTIAANGRRGRLSFSVGFSDGTLAAAGAIDVLIDGASVYTANFDTFVSWHSIDIPAMSTTIVVRLTRTTPGTTAYTMRVGQVDLIDLTNVSDPDGQFLVAIDNVLMIGDSWYDTATTWGAAFRDELETFLTSGSVVSEAISGSKISDWIASLPGWLSTHRPTKVLLHTGINELNAALSASAFWQAVETVFAACRNAGVPCLYVMQSTTASETQTQNLGTYMAMQAVTSYADRYPKFATEWLTQASSKELTNAAAVVNLRSKSVAGRSVLNVTTGQQVTPSGPAAADSWV